MWEKFIAWLNGMDPGVIKTSILAIAGGFTSLIGTLMGEHQNLFLLAVRICGSRLLHRHFCCRQNRNLVVGLWNEGDN